MGPVTETTPETLAVAAKQATAWLPRRFIASYTDETGPVYALVGAQFSTGLVITQHPEATSAVTTWDSLADLKDAEPDVPWRVDWIDLLPEDEEEAAEAAHEEEPEGFDSPQLTGVQYGLLDAVRDVALAPEAPGAGTAAAALCRLLTYTLGAPPVPLREGGLVAALFGNPLRPKTDGQPEPETDP